MTRYVHTNSIACDKDKLIGFYKQFSAAGASDRRGIFGDDGLKGCGKTVGDY
jgi:hypothetical protein